MDDMIVYSIMIAVLVGVGASIFALVRHCANTEACDED